jgi:hypothetical protein
MMLQLKNLQRCLCKNSRWYVICSKAQYSEDPTSKAKGGLVEHMQVRFL